jgi:hypothetical protein
MGKINLKRVYHIGIPVNDLERASASTLTYWE